MELQNIYELLAIYDRRNSFYGKANVLIFADGTKQLRSYNTIVAEIKDKTAKVFGYFSATTGRHINEFLQQNGFPKMKKCEMEA